ncbi:hypothetical protein R1sor_000404 [Riccia sorocarpa]|uniref:Uncharacterized protein n=1 Tax=Riccia sorocarpa TaxID=122646 RepID=A0ABD3GT16_9MARC
MRKFALSTTFQFSIVIELLWQTNKPDSASREEEVPVARSGVNRFVITDTDSEDIQEDAESSGEMEGVTSLMVEAPLHDKNLLVHSWDLDYEPIAKNQKAVLLLRVAWMGGDGFKARTTDAGIVFNATNTKGNLDVDVEDRKTKKSNVRKIVMACLSLKKEEYQLGPITSKHLFPAEPFDWENWVSERFIARSKSNDKGIASKTPQSLKRAQLPYLPSLQDAGSGPSVSREPDEYQLMLKMVEPICTADPDDNFPTTTVPFMLEDSKTPVLAKASKTNHSGN